MKGFWDRGRRAHLRLGRRGEAVIRKLYARLGYAVLASDWRCRYGELDIVSLDGGVLVFTEVKTLRRSVQFRPSDNLSRRQFLRDLRAARKFRMQFASERFPWRFELAEVVIKNLFSVSVRRRILADSRSWAHTANGRGNFGAA